ncbi:MAG: hypothetical protein KAT76_07290 [Bacteroidales bacterium]|nr:hypothetical protein [Bacteroidales bacterium]
MFKNPTVYIALLFLLYGMQLSAQDKPADWGIRFTGFVNAQAFFDTRQIVEARAGMVSLFPKNAIYDRDGRDINTKAQFNQAAMTTRLRGTITGPDALGAQTMGVIETDFTGSSNTDNNGLRLREAFVQLSWKHFKLMIGQYWHPLYVPEVRPKTIGLNLGAPFHPFARHNQIRFTYKTGSFRVIAVAASQRDYSNAGPDGRSPKYLRNAVLPNLDLQLQWKPGNHVIGAGIDYKMIQPRLSVDFPPAGEFKTDEKVKSLALTAFAKLDFPVLLIKTQLVWGQNLTEFIMLGGYVEKDIDSSSHKITYTPTSQISAWADFSTKAKRFKFGMLAGYAANLGYNGPAMGAYYGLGQDIAYLYRISPRAEWYSGRFMLGLELEYTVAAYGQADVNGIVKDTKEFGNLRFLAAAFLFF